MMRRNQFEDYPKENPGVLYVYQGRFLIQCNLNRATGDKKIKYLLTA